MKKSFILLFAGIGIFFGLCACHCNKENINPDPENSTVAVKTYVCPMNCENGKTYEKAGQCPVCGMDLAPL